MKTYSFLVKSDGVDYEANVSKKDLKTFYRLFKKDCMKDITYKRFLKMWVETPEF